MQKERKSFFERLTGIINTGAADDFAPDDIEIAPPSRRDRGQLVEGENAYARQTPPGYLSRQAAPSSALKVAVHEEAWVEEDEPVEGQLTVDVYETPSDIIIQTMVAGVRPDDLDIAITRETVTIKGKREAPRGVGTSDYCYRELYWGSFSRTIELPQEIETEGAEAIERYGMLTIRLPKIDKNRQQKLKIKSV